MIRYANYNKSNRLKHNRLLSWEIILKINRNNSMNSRITKLTSIDNLWNKWNKGSVANNNRLIKSIHLSTKNMN